jgi:hypothetical protein
MGRPRNSNYDQAFELYSSGLSLAQVAEKIGVTRQCVFKAFMKRGFALRPINLRPFQEYDGKKFTLKNTGYYALTTDDRCLMHRYVWEKERGVIPPNYDIHHINEIKSDNRIENLECLPKSEHTRLYSPHNNQYGAGKRPVVMMDLSGKEISSFESSSLAAISLGIDRTGINMAINGKLKTYKNHKWKYANS